MRLGQCMSEVGLTLAAGQKSMLPNICCAGSLANGGEEPISALFPLTYP